MKQNRVLILIVAIAMAASLALWSGSQYKVQAQGRQANAHRAASLRRRSPYLKFGFGGVHTESNQRLMYTSAWASPQ